MNNKTTLLLASIISLTILYSEYSYAQISGSKAKFDKVEDGMYFLSFNISGLADNKQAETIIAKIKANADVKTCVISEYKYCKIVSIKPILSEYIVEVLKSQNVSSDKFVVAKREDGMPEDYPVYKNTGNSAADDKKYDDAKKEWIEKNKELYKQMNSNAKNNN
ncbi:MAG: hypothetical protein WCK02_07470 [Bacteroidota bacterium]